MIDDLYQVALVGSSSPGYLWILSRTPKISNIVKAAVLDEAKAALITLLDEIHTYDTLAEEAFGLNKRLDFIKYIQEATKSLRKAADACEGVADFESVAQHLAEAYSIRFQAFVSIMDENGDIIASAGNCNTVRSAVSRSKEHIDYVSFLYE